MPISYKHKIYTTLGTPTDLSGNVVSATDSAGVPTKDYTVKGKTIVWNQMLQNPNYSNTVVDTRAYVQFMVLQNVSPYKVFLSLELQKPGLVSAIFTVTASGECRIKHNGSEDDIVFYYFTSVKDHKYYISFNFTSTNPTVVGGITFDKAQLFDLTQMFGAGNEPSTPEEFREIFPDDYYPYNAGELKSIEPTSVEASGVKRFQLLDKSKYPATHTNAGVTVTNNGDGSITANGNCTYTLNINLSEINKFTIKAKHKYLISDSSGSTSRAQYSTWVRHRTGGIVVDSASSPIGEISYNDNKCTVYLRFNEGVSVSNIIFKPQLFDLTQMFGAGNEPATPAEFWQRVPEKLYGYNPNDYKSANIPSSKYFPDGMKSAGSAYDEINFLSQKAIKRIGIVDLGTIDWEQGGFGDRTSWVPVSWKNNIKPSKVDEYPNIICPIYDTETSHNVESQLTDKTISVSQSGWVYIYDSLYKTATASDFKAAMSGVMLYYELEAPVETAITPPLQALSTYKGFTSFSATNSLTQNGPLSVTYYAEGGANPESGWLTSYKRKLYMGRNIEWNQLLDRLKFQNVSSLSGISVTNNNDGSIMFDGTKTQSVAVYFRCGTYQVIANHKYYLYGTPAGGGFATYQLYSYFTPTGGSDVFFFDNGKGVFFSGQATASGLGNIIITISQSLNAVSNLVFKPQLFDLTQMFGAGNEPATPAEFWSYFDHKVYPYNTGETQPLFKISRKSQWGSFGKLPSGYSRCAFIEATGTQWIDTEFFPSIRTKARVVFSPVAVNSFGFFGARKDPNRFNCTTFGSGSSFAFSVSVGSWSANKTPIALGSVYDCVAENGVQIINGVHYTEPTISSLGDCGSFKLATISSGGNVETGNDCNKCRWFSVQIWENLELVRDMIPALDRGYRPCMYDTVSGKSFYNQGSGEFLYELA